MTTGRDGGQRNAIGVMKYLVGNLLSVAQSDFALLGDVLHTQRYAIAAFLKPLWCSEKTCTTPFNARPVRHPLGKHV